MAYLVTPESIIYNNEGANVRSYADVSAFTKICQYFNKIDEAQPYIFNILNKIHPKNVTDEASKISLLLDFNMTEKSELTHFVNKVTNDDGIFTSDLSFGNPQIMIVLLRISKLIPKLRPTVEKSFRGFINTYRNKLNSIIENDGAFAANWILQALSENKSTTLYKDLLPPLIKVCKKALKETNNITLVACALNGLLSIKEPVDINSILIRWRDLQQKWGTGGFRYYVDEPWYRTDVTSHVVEDCFLILNI